MAQQRPGLTDSTGHSRNINATVLTDTQVVEVNNLSFIVANDLDTVLRDEVATEIGELPLPPQSYVFSFNGATGNVQGVGSFNGATGAVSYEVDGGEFT